MKNWKARVPFAVLMSGVTTCLVSFVLVSVNMGYKPGFVLVWLRSWAIAFTMVALAILFLAPRIQKFLEKP